MMTRLAFGFAAFFGFFVLWSAAPAHADNFALCARYQREFDGGAWSARNLSDLRTLARNTPGTCPQLRAKIDDSIAGIEAQSNDRAAAGAVCARAQAEWTDALASSDANVIEGFRDRYGRSCPTYRDLADAELRRISGGAPRTVLIGPTSGPLAVGQSRAGALTDSDPAIEGVHYDDYPITLAAGQGISITLASRDFDAVVRIGHGGGDQYEAIAMNDDGDEGLDSLLRFAAPTAGDYVIRASSLGAETGDYVIGVQTFQMAPPPAPRPLGWDQPRSSRLADSGARLYDEDNQLYEYWTFRGRAGERIRVHMRSGDFDSFVQIGRINPQGVFEPIVYDDDSGASVNALAYMLVPDDGEYVIRTQSLSPSGSGVYDVLLERAPAPPASVAMQVPARPNAVILSGALGNASPVIGHYMRYQDFRFPARANTTYVITMRSGSFDPFLEMGQVAGGAFTEIAHDDDSGEGVAARLEFTPPRNGEYVLRARSVNNGASGDFELVIVERAH